MNKNETFQDIFRAGYSRMLNHGRCNEWQKRYYDSPGFMLAVAGTGDIFYHEEYQHLHSGDLVIYDALPRQAFRNEGGWFFYWVHFPTSMMENYEEIPYTSSVLGARVIHFQEKEMAKLKILFKELMEINRELPYWWKYAESLVNVVLSAALNKIQFQENIPLKQQNISHLLDSFSAEMSINELARKFGISRSAFYLHFQKEYGCSPLEYRNNMILTRAKAFLRNTDLQVKRIAEILKFRDSHYFSTFFSRYIHLTPQEYRSKMVGRIKKQKKDNAKMEDKLKRTR